MIGINVLSEFGQENTAETEKETNITKHFIYVYLLEYILGINRIYLLTKNKFWWFVSYLFSVIIIGFIGYNVVIETAKLENKKDGIVTATYFSEFVILITYNVAIGKEHLLKFYSNLETVDEILKIKTELAVTTCLKNTYIWIAVLLSIHAFDIAIYVVFEMHYPDLLHENFIEHFHIIFILEIVHDVEQVFYFTHLRIVYNRLKIVKKHVEKLFSQQIDRHKLNKFEILSRNVDFDITSLHNVYGCLFKCATQLNSVLGFPLLSIFLASGVIVIMYLETLLALTYHPEYSLSKLLIGMYVVLKSVFMTLLVIIPCYYSSVTAAQVGSIRNTLYEAIWTLPLSKTDRRKVKAFLCLTKDSSFNYALGGVVPLSMKLTVNYINLCITYFIISVNFAKFLD